jgi:hypothetical protein
MMRYRILAFLPSRVFDPAAFQYPKITSGQHLNS